MTVLSLILVGVVIVQATMLHARGWRIVGGTLPDWLEALGGIATVLALIVAWRVYRHDVSARADDKVKRALDERRRQAELLTGWFIHGGGARLRPRIADGTRPGPIPAGMPQEVINVAEVGLINASQVIVYDLIVAAVCEPSPPIPVIYGPADIQMTEPVEWNPERDTLARGRAKVLAPGQWSVDLRLATTSVKPTALHLFFRDHQGVYWWRDARGRLTEQVPPPDDGRGRERQIAEALGEPTDGRVRDLAVRPLADKRAT